MDEDTVMFLIGYLTDPEEKILSMINEGKHFEKTLKEIVEYWQSSWGGLEESFLEKMGVEL